MRTLDAFQPSAIRKIHDRAQALRAADPQRTLIPLHFGESDLGTPDFIVEAGCRALREGAVFYEDNSGRRDLKETLADHYTSHRGAVLHPDQIVLSCGGVQAILLTMLGLVEPGDDVFVITPAWPNLAETARIAGGVVHEIALHFSNEDNTFSLDLDRLAHAMDTATRPRVVVINTPSNPTGWVASNVVRHDLLNLCRRYGTHLLADEMYDRILFDGAAQPTILSFDGEDLSEVTVINGFSKAYCMTGWRLGYLITQPDRAAGLARMQEFVTSHAPSMAQVAAITALRDGETFIRNALARYAAARALALERLASIEGVTVPIPQGAFYLFFQVPGASDSVSFCQRLLEETGVVLAPGAAFGRSGEGWLRLCFATRPQRLAEALDRLDTFVTRHSTAP